MGPSLKVAQSLVLDGGGGCGRSSVPKERMPPLRWVKDDEVPLQDTTLDLVGLYI